MKGPVIVKVVKPERKNREAKPVKEISLKKWTEKITVK